jgi:hypothetical protein
MSELYNMINTLKKTCKDTTLLGNFIENHDLPRFAKYVFPYHSWIPLFFLTPVPFLSFVFLFNSYSLLMAQFSTAPQVICLSRRMC